MHDELKKAAKQRGLAELLPLIERLPAASVAVDPALLVAPLPDLPRLVTQLRRAGLSPRLVAAALPRLGRLEAALLAHDTLLVSLSRKDERLLSELRDAARLVEPLYGVIARTPYVPRPPEGLLAWTRRVMQAERAPDFSFGLETLARELADESGPRLGEAELEVVIPALLELHHAGMTGIASFALRLLSESTPSPLVEAARLEVGLDVGELKLAPEADQTGKEWFVAYVGQRNADVPFQLGVETDAGANARRSLYARLQRLTFDRDLEFLTLHRTELAVAWVRAELAMGGPALDRCAQLIDAICRRTPSWRYAAETRVLVVARQQPETIAALLRDHTKRFGLRGTLFSDLLALRPADGPRAANVEAIAAKLYGEVVGRPWDSSLWLALRHLLSSSEAVAWFGSIEEARRRQRAVTTSSS